MSGEDRAYDRELLEFERERRRDVERLIRWYFPLDQQSRAMWTAWRLSSFHSGDLSAMKSNQWGLFHIDPLSVDLPENEGWRLLDPIRNVAAAFKLWKRFGWAVFGPDIPDLPDPFAETEVPL